MVRAGTIGWKDQTEMGARFAQKFTTETTETTEISLSQLCVLCDLSG